MEGFFNLILYPITSTQLGVFSNFLDMRKLDVLSAVDAKALKFKRLFLDQFVQYNSADITKINEAKEARRTALKNMDSLWKEPIMDQDAWARNWREYEKLKGLRQKRYELRDLFNEKLKTTDPSLIELPSDALHQVMRNNPRMVAGISHAFNLLGAVGATYSVFKEIFTPDSGLRQGNWRDIASVTATAIGGVGSIKGTIDLAKVLKEKLFKPRPTERFYIQRTSEELATFEEELATEVSVNLNNMERFSSRLARMAEAKTIGRVFTAFGVVADGIFLGISIYDLYKDFTADSRDDWKIADDFLFAASAGIGAALGKC